MDTLYYSPGSCSLIVHCLLEEMGIAFEARRVVKRQEHLGRVCEERRRPEEKRWLLDEWLARERRHQPVVAL